MTAAVTGASGHIGNNLCRELLKEGYKVKALVREDVDALQNFDVEFVKGDISNKESLQKLTKDADVVFHLAAIISITGNSKDILTKINIEGTKNIIEASLKQNVKRFIHFSSVHAISQYPLNKPLTENNSLVGKDAYAYDRSKAGAEKVVLEACKNGLNAVILNPTSVIGINDYKPSLLGQAFLKIAKGKLPALIPGGFDWVDVRDVVKAAITAINKGEKGERYLLPGYWRSLEDLATEINLHTGKKNPIKFPLFVAKIGVPFISLYSKIFKKEPLYTFESLNILNQSNKNISNKKAKEELNYNPRKFEETIEDTYKWFVKQNLIKT